MSLTEEQNAKMRGIAARAKALILTPKAEWTVIDGERPALKNLYTGYVMILAAIPAVCSVIGGLIFSSSAWALVRFSPVSIITSGVVSYVLALAGVFVMGLLIENIAPSFGGVKDRMQAMKVAAYFPTAAWVAGVFDLVPGISVLSILGLYSLYLLYLGLPRLMKVAEDKALVFTLVVILAAIVVEVLIFTLVGAARVSMMPVTGGLY